MCKRDDIEIQEDMHLSKSGENTASQTSAATI